MEPGPLAERPSDQFDSWLSDVIEMTSPDERNAKLVRWLSAPSARIAHPREEHLLPLMVVAGAAGKDQGCKIFSDRVMGATVSAYQFG